MYRLEMRRVQFYIEESLDEVLHAEAAKHKRSKSSLIRECVSARYGDNVRTDSDPLTALIGTVDIDPEDIDNAAYGNETCRRRH